MCVFYHVRVCQPHAHVIFYEKMLRLFRVFSVLQLIRVFITHASVLLLLQNVVSGIV
jgi:hypothetical protein